MKIAKISLLVCAALALPLLSSAQTKPTYTPPPKPSYTPPPAPKPSYTPPPRPASPPPAPRPSYTPPPSRPPNPPPAPRPSTPPPQPRTTPSQPANNFHPAAQPVKPPVAPNNPNNNGRAPGGSNSPQPPAAKGPVNSYSPANNHAASPSNPAQTFQPASSRSSTAMGSGSAVVTSDAPHGVTTYSTSHAAAAPAASPAMRPASPAGSSFSAGASAGFAAPANKTAVRPAYNLPSSEVTSRTPTGSAVLSSQGSASVMTQVNSSRAGMGGINRDPIPAGQVTAHANGSLTVTAHDGRQFGVRPNGTLASFHGNGQAATFRANGSFRTVRTNTVFVSHGSFGQRTVVYHGADRTVVVSRGPRFGYVQRPVFFNGHAYVTRSYVVGGSAFVRVYTPYPYHGVMLHSYVPGVYFGPAFYGWAYYPWAAPAPYAWGWTASPWYGYYGPYFAASPYYPSPALWLTDFYLSQTLDASYRAQMQSQAEQAAADDSADQDPNAAAAPVADDEAVAQVSSPITPELKEAIAGEVQQQISYENAGAAAPRPEDAVNLAGLPQVLVPNHLFVVDQGLSVTTSSEQACGLSSGDIIRLAAAPAADSATADLVVATSRQSDCPVGVTVTVSLDDLSEMHNAFRAQIDAGLKALHDGQGQNGLPAAPPSAMAVAPRVSEEVPTDNINVQAQLQAAQNAGTEAEVQVKQSAAAANNPNPGNGNPQ